MDALHVLGLRQEPVGLTTVSRLRIASRFFFSGSDLLHLAMEPVDEFLRLGFQHSGSGVQADGSAPYPAGRPYR